MDVKSAIQTRRSVKEFDVDYVMPQEDIDQLMSLAMLSPTAFNIQHWRFISVTDTALREDIRARTFKQSQVTDASLFLVICADLMAWNKEPSRYWRNAPEDSRNAILGAMRGYYENWPQVQRDEVMRSCGIAAQTLMLAAAGMGYQSCPMDLSDFDSVGELINLPEDHVVVMYLAIGKGTQEPRPRGGQLRREEVVIENRFSNG